MERKPGEGKKYMYIYRKRTLKAYKDVKVKKIAILSGAK